MKKPRLYTTPFVVAWIMLIIGLLGAFNLAYLPLIISDYDGMSGGFAIAFVGGFIAIMGIVVFGVYGKLNRDFARMLAGDTLLTYVMPADIYAFFSRKQAEDIKQNNKMVLIMILGFCVLFGVIFGLAVDTLFIIIFLCIAVFFTIVYFLATAVRTKKVKKSQALVCLSGGGAYIFGEMHSWSIPGTWLNAVSYTDAAAAGLPCPAIQIAYTAMSGIVPQQREVTIPVLPQLVNQGFWAANTLKGMYRI
jgi:hypothetical protein